jgi:ABC-type transport system involved in multi-copper enzyme maturation permease subunit
LRVVKVVGVVALNMFRESVRDKVLYNLVFFALLLIGGSYLIGQLTAGQDVKMIKDLGLAATSIFGVFIAVFIGIGLVSKEVERRSIYSVLSKPITRPQLLLGKYLGLALTLAVNLTVMAAALYLVLAYMAWMAGPAAHTWEVPALDPAMLKAVGLTFLELAIVTAIALFFSTFSSPMLSAAFTLGLFVVGRFSADLRNINDVVQSPAASVLAHTLYWILPNLSPFDVRAEVVHGIPVTAGYIALTAGYGLFYIAAVLVAATLVFSRRDFK